MDKKFKNVTSQRNEMSTPNVINQRNDLFTPKCNAIFNSTAKFSDFAAVGDISTISSIPSSVSDSNYESTVVSKNPTKKTASDGSIEDKQLELDNLYAQYLMLVYIKENLRKTTIDFEENAAKEIYELCTAEETLKTQNNALKNEVERKENFLKILDFIDSLEQPVLDLVNHIGNFQKNFKRLADLCENAQNHIVVKGLSLPKNIQEFEENMSIELNKSITLLKRILDYGYNSEVDFGENINTQSIDIKLLEELLEQHKVLKTLIITLSGLKTMDSLRK